MVGAVYDREGVAVKAHAILAVSLLVLATLSGPAAAGRIDRTFHQSFNVSEGFSLELENGDGDVVITPSGTDEIDVTVRCLADVKRIGPGGDPDFEVEFESGADAVGVKGRFTPSGISVFEWIKIHEYVYTIEAPSYVTLEIRGDDGDISIEDWRAAIDCSSDDGDVLLDGFTGRTASFSFDDGDVTVKRAEGSLEFSGDDGDVSLSECGHVTVSIALDDGDVSATECGGDVAVSLDDGDVTLDLIETATTSVDADDGDLKLSIQSGEVERVDLSSDDGNVVVSMPEGGSYSYSISMDDGGLKLDLPGQQKYDRDEHSVRGEVRGGGAHLSIYTDDGDVVVTGR